MSNLHLFEGFGIELEYMIVRSGTLDVFPVSDRVLRAASGKFTNFHDSGKMGWSNEIVRHVMEIKNNRPVNTLKGLGRAFSGEIKKINAILSGMDGRLMPTGMHPWMNPRKETVLWQRRYRRIYETYDRIFNCRRHGWANIQSMHINLSFSGDDEFDRLHTAVRLLLPVLPAIAASSPFTESGTAGFQDRRLRFYGSNQKKVPSIMGRIIPEYVRTKKEYEHRILGKMYKDIAPHDTEGRIQNEWLNSRGAIPRFERSAIEIRVVDVQECPEADIAVAAFVIAVLTSLVEQRWCSYEEQAKWKNGPLVTIFQDCIRSAEQSVITNRAYLDLFRFPESRATAGELWKYLYGEVREAASTPSGTEDIVDMILEYGPLSRRILKAAGGAPSRERLIQVYGKLCDCLASGDMFLE